MSDDDQEFTIPLPPPPFGGPHRDVLYFRAPEGSGPGKEHEDIMLRRVPRESAMAFRAGAGGRGLTHAQYLKALVDLHARLRARADEGDEPIRKLLDDLGMGSVTV